MRVLLQHHSSSKATLSHLFKNNPPSHKHTLNAPPLLLGELHRAKDVMKGHRDCKQTHNIDQLKADSPKHQ